MSSDAATNVTNATYSGKLRDSIWWYLNASRPFVINDEYKIELLEISERNRCAKIRVTNLKTNRVEESQQEI